MFRNTGQSSSLRDLVILHVDHMTWQQETPPSVGEFLPVQMDRSQANVSAPLIFELNSALLRGLMLIIIEWKSALSNI
jgi:hypothetical protein